MKDSLWNRNFKIMFLGTVLSALGGIGLNAALSVVVFDYTQSTFLMSLFISVVSLPHLIFPLFIGVFVDRHDPLKTLLKNESILIVFYICFLIVYLSIGFRYVFFLLITCCISSFGVVSDLANQSISAQLMNKNTMSRGYAILSTIYPLCNVIVVPLALFVYKKYGLEILMVVYIVLSTLDLLIESRIDAKFEFNQNNSSCSVKDDFKSGFKYLHTKKTYRNCFYLFYNRYNDR